MSRLPGPLAVEHDPRWSWANIVCNGAYIAKQVPPSYAAFIVEACNAHMINTECAAKPNDTLLRVAELEGALREIERGQGRYDLNPLKHASNVIDEMRETARAALKGKA